MATCSNCYTGCTQITSDKCVKYTGLANTVLGIQNGDSINYTTSTLMCWVTDNSNGSGIKYELDPGDMCTIMSQYLVDCTDITVIDITKALSKAICDLDTTTTTLVNAEAALEAAYTIPACISAVGTDGTHSILQSTMTQVCVNTSSISSINLNLLQNYVAIADIDTYIADYIANNAGGGEAGYASNMVPYTVVEYYGSTAFFDATGAGTGDWVNIYLCNGENTTPDKRGRVAVGTTTGMLGGTFDNTVNPALQGNPTYTLRSTEGSNTVTLTTAQIPGHTHTITDPGHTHTVPARNGTMLGDYTLAAGGGSPNDDTLQIENVASTNNTTGSSTTGIAVNSAGGGGSHSNVQPVLACHYIMYIPAP